MRSAGEEKGNLKEYVYNEILDEIFAGELPPGSILNEKALIEKYQCSKSPVREALLSLCSENVLRSIPRYGYEVVRLTRQDIDEMIRFRIVLESGFLRLGIERFTEADLQLLEEINGKCMLPEADLWAHWEYNTEFHTAMMRIAGNNYAAEELTRCMNQMKRAYALAYHNRKFPEPRAYTVDTRHHTQIIEALRRKDAEEACRLLREDFLDFGGADELHSLYRAIDEDAGSRPDTDR